MSGYAFHAGPPPGEWFNDPNGLAYFDGAYRLFVQHASDAPEFAARNWARLSSPDLLRWTFDGPVMRADDRGRRYSGSIVPGPGRLEAYLTLDDRNRTPRQRQVRAVSRDAGAKWSLERDSIGPAGHDIRDPFVWTAGDGARHMLVAHPGNWDSAEQGERSFLSLWTETDGGPLARTATIGPWHPPGMLWEVPAVVELGGVHALILSLVDRRRGATRCEVRYWLGRMDKSGFSIRPGFPRAGRRLDHGPDYYAAIPNAVEGWPLSERVVVAWAAAWSRLRSPSQERGSGGPITLPRSLRLGDKGLHVSPIAAALPHASATWDLSTSERPHICIVTSEGRWRFRLGPDSVAIEHDGIRRSAPLPVIPAEKQASLFYDGDLIELFVAGVAFTLRGELIDVLPR